MKCCLPMGRTSLVRDERGATIVEFAIVIPVLAMILLYLFDTGYYLYAKAVLGGEVNAAGRASSLETASDETRGTLDQRVSTQVKRLVPTGNVSFLRTSYKSYSRAQTKAEAFNDVNGNGRCDNNETFDDANRNGTRDLDSGVDGGGGAKDVTIYTATLRYRSLFPLKNFIGGNPDVVLTSSTILRNQPFDKQAEPLLGKCT